MLAKIRGAGNAVAVDSENMGLSTYSGPGAGRFPTANSVVADIMRLAAGRASPLSPKQTDSLSLESDYESSFYIRITTGSNIIRRVAELSETHGVSIKSLSLLDETMVIMTNPCMLSNIEALSQALVAGNYCTTDPVFLPLLQ